MTSIETIIDRQIRRWKLQKSLEEARHGLARSIHLPKPLITVSRQRGSCGSSDVKPRTTTSPHRMMVPPAADRSQEIQIISNEDIYPA